MIGYITTTYPLPSHRFILREVEALRRLGFEVSTAAGRHGQVVAPAAEDEERALRTTYTLRPLQWREIATAQLRAIGRHPRAFASTFRIALGMGRPGLRGRLWQFFYLIEAVVLWHYWRRHRTLHVHAHHAAVPTDIALLATHFARRSGQGPTSWSFTLHGPAELFDVRWFELARKIERADAVVCISDFARSQAMALVEERHWSKLTVIHCGVPLNLYRSLGPPPTGSMRVLCVGRLVPEKGQAMLLQAIKALADRNLDLDVDLVGEGPTRPALDKLSRELALEDRVHFAGLLGEQEILQHYQAATIFCLPSFAEGVPVVVMEAMAAGRPVVATGVAGIPELVRDGDTGLLVSPGRVDELVDALQRLVLEPELRQRLAARGRDHVTRHHDLQACARQLGKLFSTLTIDRETTV